ncbi:PilZ domain-containing protein [Paenibacillus agricola]|uniref:PilZ domain-containing protein n=1 Tax=Paenibacillus agricola TaxID=2716264 RepID=A0ABX0JAZ6_9BACL|nr:PilZ domain-containing protein [Paenibacillus agricola]NHN31314.1 PilZ domain-containing protein [Paenibacillus agricola]
MLENITLINQNHDLKGKVIEFKDELMLVQIEEEHQVKTTEYILALYKGKQIEAKVIVVKPGEIGLFIPLLPVDYFNDRRNFPRLKVDFPAVVIQETLESTGLLERIIHVRVHDVSHRGFSFSVESGDEIKLEWASRLILQSEQLPILCDIIVNNHAGQSESVRYGASIQFMSTTNVRMLYEFIFSRRM